MTPKPHSDHFANVKAALYGTRVAAVRYICPDAPAQVTATWEDMERDECPWCHRPLVSHDHHLWSIVTGAAQGEHDTGKEPSA